MSRTKHFTLTVALSAAFAAGNAAAALFDTIESVEPLQKIAAQKKSTDRMPAGKPSETKDAETAGEETRENGKSAGSATP